MTELFGLAMTEQTQQTLSTWIPPQVLVAGLVFLLGCACVLAMAWFNLKLQRFVSVKDFSRSVGALHEKINAVSTELHELKAVLADREHR